MVHIKLSIAKLKVLWRDFSNYVRYDFREIAFPSSLPDPPGSKDEAERKLTLRDRLECVQIGTKLYIRSWRTGSIYEKTDKDKEAEKDKKREPSAAEDLAIAARAGAEHIKPALQRIYLARAAVYRDALREFIEGYQEGIRETIGSGGSIFVKPGKPDSAPPKQDKGEEPKVNRSS